MLEDFRHCMAFHGSKLANKNGKNHRYIIKIIKTIPHDSTKIQQISINVPYILWLLLDSSGLACRSAGGLDPLHRKRRCGLGARDGKILWGFRRLGFSLFSSFGRLEFPLLFVFFLWKVGNSCQYSHMLF